jgi:hypothetical protein
MFLVLFPLSNSFRTKVFKRGDMQTWFEYEFLCKKGLLQLGLLPALKERKSHLFFLFMYLYPLLNMVGYVWVLSVLILAPFFGYPWANSLMFST